MSTHHGDHEDSDRSNAQLLDGIDIIADAYLGNLALEDVLQAITRRLGDVLEVDTAAVLLLDAAGDFLEARAAFGIEQEVREGVRIPLGKGFAGRIAVEGRPVHLDRVDETTVENPILWESGIEAMLGVPLLDAGSVLGVLHVGSKRPRAFDDREVRTLQLVAEQLAASLRSRGTEIERLTANVLQRSLLPSRLPESPVVEFATRYVPAELGGVGGDWYDAFHLPDGQLWVMVGDVAGHGLMPAVIMGRLRSALRSYALEGHDPEHILALADRKLEFFEPGSMATVLLAVLAPPYDRLTVASAGHPPAVMALPGEEATLVEVPVGVPLGVGGAGARQSATVGFPAGATLVACTDGLIERRSEPLDLGIELLRRTVHADDPERVCRKVMHALVGDHVPRDDIAVIAIRKKPS